MMQDKVAAYFQAIPVKEVDKEALNHRISSLQVVLLESDYHLALRSS